MRLDLLEYGVLNITFYISARKVKSISLYMSCVYRLIHA